MRIPRVALLLLTPLLALVACSPTSNEPEAASKTERPTPATSSAGLVDPPFLGVDELWGREGLGPWRGGQLFHVQGNLVEVWNDAGNLAMRQFRAPASGAGLELVWEGTHAEGYGTHLLVLGDSIIQFWDNNGRLGMMQYRLRANGIGFDEVWATANIGEGYSTRFFALGNNLIQLWNNNGQTATIHYALDTDGSGFVWRANQTHAEGHGLEYVAYGDSLLQFWDNNGHVGAIQYRLRADGQGLDEVWGDADLERPWGGEFHVIGQDVLQLRNNNGRLAMVRYAPLAPQGFAAQPEQPDVGTGFGPRQLVVGSTLVQLWNANGRLGVLSHVREPNESQYTWKGGVDMFAPYDGNFLAMGNVLVQARDVNGQLALLQYGLAGCYSTPHLTQYGYYNYYNMLNAPALNLAELKDHTNLAPVYMFPQADARAPETVFPALHAAGMKGLVFLWGGELEDGHGKLITGCSAAEKAVWLPKWTALANRLQPYVNDIGGLYFEEMHWRQLHGYYVDKHGPMRTAPVSPDTVLADLELTNQRLSCLLQQVRADFPNTKIVLAETPEIFSGDLRGIRPNLLCKSCVAQVRIPKEVDFLGTYFYQADPSGFRAASQRVRSSCNTWSEWDAYNCLENGDQPACIRHAAQTTTCVETLDGYQLSDAMQAKLQPPSPLQNEQRLFAIPASNTHPAANATERAQASLARRSLLNNLYAMAANNPRYVGLFSYYWAASYEEPLPEPGAWLVDENGLGRLPLNNPLRKRYWDVGRCILPGRPL
ncbi:hypothetical protein [Pyxidicoccus caerfyrddinensis]|uniref:hypothetical protein n=1 Tax=Pyxidicoccus caerfyrddinensis TaxID=2709663 RepID=UPI0013DBD334|nr:hypothetical protein [Pyxidicoccus caerfyrddinensis]